MLLQGHQELSGKSDENKSFQPKPISSFYLYYDRTLLLFSRPMRDKDTSAFREMFQYPSWLWPSSRPNQMDLILMDYCTWQFLVSLLSMLIVYPAGVRAWRACALRALGLLLADSAPTVGRGEDFLSRQPNFFTETAVTPEQKVEKSFPRWEINRHDKG